MIAKILPFPTYDRGFLYADGFFTTMRARFTKHDHRLFFYNLHYDRIQKSCAAMQIANLFTKHQLKKAIVDLIKYDDQNTKDFLIKIIITRGNQCKRSLFEENLTPSFYIDYSVCDVPFHNDFNDLDLKSISCGVSPYTHSGKTELSPFKTLNYQIGILSRLSNKNFEESLLINRDGHVVGVTIGNIVVKKNGRFITPFLNVGCIEGVMRAHLLSQKIIEEDILRLEDCLSYPCYRINSVRGIDRLCFEDWKTRQK